MKFRSYRKDVKDRMAKANELMLDAVGRQGVTYVQADTPVDTGALRGSIDYSVTDDGVYVGSTLTEDYVIFVHEGTRFQMPQPYIRNGIYNNLNALKALAEQTYQKGL